MGNIFANPAEDARKQEEARWFQEQYRQQEQAKKEEQRRQQEEQRRLQEAQNQIRLQREAQQRQIEREQQRLKTLARQEVLSQITLIVSILKLQETTLWSTTFDRSNYETVVRYKQLDSQADEYTKVEQKFNYTTKNQGYNITQIDRVENPSLYGQYLLKKLELESRYGYVQVKWLFHGTNRRNVDDICTDNLNWRCHGQNIGHRFGQGTSFSPIAAYASHYCDKGAYVNTMLLCFVLVAKECMGSPEMVIPPIYNERQQLRYDTAYRNDEKRSVIVKFTDYEYYPMYRITFTGYTNRKLRR